MIELGPRRGHSCDLFLNFIRCSLCLCVRVWVTRQRRTLIQCLARGTEGSRKREGGWGVIGR